MPTVFIDRKVMGRRARRSRSLISTRSDPRAGASPQFDARRSLPRTLSSVLRYFPDDSSQPPARVVRVSLPRLGPWVPSSLSSFRPAPLPGRRFAPAARQGLLNALQRTQTLHRYSTPCEARARRRSVLHALGIAGRSGVGRGKRRVVNQYSNMRCR